MNMSIGQISQIAFCRAPRDVAWGHAMRLASFGSGCSALKQAVLATAGILTGCGGPPSGAVSGIVRFEGKPCGDSAVVFMSLETGASSSANLEPDGSFKLPKRLAVGEYRVYLSPKAGAVSHGADGQPAPAPLPSSIPVRYTHEASTDITVNVRAGVNEFSVDINK